MENLSARASGQIEAVPITSNSKIRKVFSRKPRHILVTLLSVSLLLISQFTKAQAPQQFSFQGVARDATGKIVKDTPVSVRIKIHKDSPIGAVVFSETQIVTTNSSGIFDLVIGGLAGGLGNVNWASDNCFIQTEIDVAGGANFINLGTTQLKSVPYALVSRQWVNNAPIIQTGTLDSGPILPNPSVGANLIWYPKKAAFRVGALNISSFWEDVNVGKYSFSAGFNTTASAESTISIGNYTSASKLGAIALGVQSFSTGNFSMSIGLNNSSSGEGSTAIGVGSTAKSNGSISIGSYNSDSDLEGATSSSDRVFQLGNGASNVARSNAITVLRNGNIGIGNNVLNPAFVLDVGARARIRHNSGGFTAGIYFDDSQNSAQGFVGMVNDDEVGLFVGSAWRLVVNKSGTVYAQKFQQFSDRRLKTNIKPVQNSMANLRAIRGYNYHWKNPKDDQGLQTGVIAQELEEKFPELVTTNKDGYKSVNYIGLIPHLIEAVKELDKRTDEITRLKKELAEVREINKRMTTLEAELKSLLTGNTSAIGKSHAK